MKIYKKYIPHYMIIIRYKKCIGYIGESISFPMINLYYYMLYYIIQIANVFLKCGVTFFSEPERVITWPNLVVCFSMLRNYRPHHWSLR